MCERCKIESPPKYGYHVTTYEIARRIKIGGMRSLISRTKNPNALPKAGAFAEQKNAILEKILLIKERDVFAKVLKAGISIEQIINNPAVDLDSTISTGADSADAIVLVGNEVNEKISNYCLRIKLSSRNGSNADVAPSKSINSSHISHQIAAESATRPFSRGVQQSTSPVKSVIMGSFNMSSSSVAIHGALKKNAGAKFMGSPRKSPISAESLPPSRLAAIKVESSSAKMNELASLHTFHASSARQQSSSLSPISPGSLRGALALYEPKKNNEIITPTKFALATINADARRRALSRVGDPSTPKRPTSMAENRSFLSNPLPMIHTDVRNQRQPDVQAPTGAASSPLFQFSPAAKKTILGTEKAEPHLSIISASSLAQPMSLANQSFGGETHLKAASAINRHRNNKSVGQKKVMSLTRARAMTTNNVALLEQNHFIRRLALELRDMHFLIEQKLTARNNYFIVLSHLKAIKRYAASRKNYVVLRVELKDLKLHTMDESEGDAIKTEEDVDSSLIQFSNIAVEFFENSDLSDSLGRRQVSEFEKLFGESWKPISDLEPSRTSGERPPRVGSQV